MENLNTITTMKMASSALQDKLEATKTNIKKMMAQAGVETYKTVKVNIPKIPGEGDDVQFVGLNGVNFHFMKGTTIDMPEPLYNLLRDCGKI
jgi:hypothetical protein